MDVVDTAEDAAGLELPPLSSASRSRRSSTPTAWAAARRGRRIGEGHSNVTYLVERGDGRVLLRRPPRPPLPPSAHDVLREARLLAALEPRRFARRQFWRWATTRRCSACRSP